MKKTVIGMMAATFLLVGGMFWLANPYVPALLGDPSKQLAYAKKLEAKGKMAEAMPWYRKAAEAGVRDAALRMGLAYQDGPLDDHIPHDKNRAAPYFIQAAEAGEPVAMAMVAVLFEGGIGVPKNEKAAYIWYSRAALGGHELAIEKMIEISTKGELGEEISPEAAQRWRERLNALPK